MKELRKCPKCTCTYDDPNDFPVDNSRKSGRYPYCKECAVKLQAEWRLANPEKHKQIVARRNARTRA